MLDHIQATRFPIPRPRRDPVFTLADIVGTSGAQDIERSGAITFHAVGDTGHKKDSPQGRRG
jgi:hypothetical protein